MPWIETSAGDALFYREDCHAPPWVEPVATLLLHAEAETGDAWYGWVPQLAARGRVIRPDLRGAGRSVAMRPGQAWSLDRLVDDALALLDALEVEAAHVVAARLAGPLAIRLAAACPERVLTLALCSTTPDPAAAFGARAEAWAAEIEADGIDAWAVEAAQERLGADAEEEMLQGWCDMLAATDPATLASLYRNLAAFDVTADLDAIACPVLIAARSGDAAAHAWQGRIAAADLLLLPGRGDHVAAREARDLAVAVESFQRAQVGVAPQPVPPPRFPEFYDGPDPPEALDFLPEDPDED